MLNTAVWIWAFIFVVLCSYFGYYSDCSLNSVDILVTLRFAISTINKYAFLCKSLYIYLANVAAICLSFYTCKVLFSLTSLAHTHFKTTFKIKNIYKKHILHYYMRSIILINVRNRVYFLYIVMRIFFWNFL